MDDSLLQCRDCKQTFPATAQFFYPSKKHVCGFVPQCKECRSEYVRQRYARQHSKEGLQDTRQKICLVCNQTKFLHEFKPIGSGYHSVCRECMKGQPIKKASGPQPKRHIILPETKVCSKCEEVKPLDETHFSPRPKSIDGFSGTCRVCIYKSGTERVHKRHMESPPVFNEEILKECSVCHEQYPATPRHFDRNKRKPDGLDIRCKLCKKIKGKEWRLKNADEIQWTRFMYREANREHIREQGRIYTRAHRAEQNARLRVRHDQIKQNGGDFTASDVQRQYKIQQGKCYWCNQTLSKYHIDHIEPVSRGGSNSAENIVLACPFCNMSKGNKTIEEWMRYLEKFILPRIAPQSDIA